MQTKSIDHSYHDQKLINFLNYYLANGPLNLLTGNNKKTAEYIRETFNPDEEVYRYHQELGGVFTSNEQLAGIPGMNQDRLNALDCFVSRLDLVKLEELAPKTSWNNQVEAYVNGPESLAMILSEIKGAQSYIHLSVMQFFNDQSGNLIAEALLDAINRGVRVRIMVNYENTHLYGLKTGTGRKFIVIDGNTSILGSLNIGDMHLYQTPPVPSELVKVFGNPSQ
ncbi:hypothetical protein [Paenibacillus sp. GP183]|uniref:phospholipase D-like domain-containing protein n=1 Tax=Paenibacillus sp. GP183 TaxID=1882751 RepID=UPI000B87B64B|nr:hypothetical protein [Paenibacillus sp. GP183]